ncbi:hypothetical protein [Kaarinaea lacus]
MISSNDATKFPVIKLVESLKAWNGPDFKVVFKNEVGRLDGRLLPLQEGISHGSVANEDDFSVVVLEVSELPQSLQVKAGIFYSSLIAGCACADDPTPENRETEYVEVMFDISNDTAETSISLCE